MNHHFCGDPNKMYKNTELNNHQAKSMGPIFMPNYVHVDFETRSAALLTPVKVSVGSYKYSLDPTTQLLCACYALDNDPIKVFAPWWLEIQQKQVLDPKCAITYLRKNIKNKHRFKCPDDLRNAVLAGYLVVAHNAMFERVIWDHILTPFYGWPKVRPEQWVCSMATARYNGLPGSLSDVAKTLRLSVQKGDDTAMKKMCKPRNAWVKSKKGACWFADTNLYHDLIKYCARDVEVERAIFHACKPLPPRERAIWLMDQEINFNGVPIDVALAEAASIEADSIFEAACKELTGITKGFVTAPTQRERLLAWLQRSILIDNMQSATIEYHLRRDKREHNLRSDVRRALEIRQLAGGNALTKYKAFLRFSVDGLIYDSHRYYGGHTGRASGQHTQTQNLIRPPLKQKVAEAYIDDILDHNVIDNTFYDGVDTKPVLDSLVRGCIRAQPGHYLFAIDYSSVEARGVNWVAGQWDAVENFRRGICAYRKMAAAIFNVDGDSLSKDSFERKVGKETELGAGYGMGPPRFQENCGDKGIELNMALSKRAIYTYRNKHPRVKALWDALDAAVKRCIISGREQFVGRNLYIRMEVIHGQRVLVIVLPSGRSLYYHRPEVVDGRIRYYGRKNNGGLAMIDTWGGGFTENVVQAFCRDLLMGAMLRISKVARIVMHVHDEVVCHVRKELAEPLYKEVCDILTDVPVWAKGMPIAVEGWIGERYRK